MLSRQDVKHVANLAKLDLTEEEIKQFGHQLSEVLDYINQLNEVDTNDVLPTAQVTGLENILREDKEVSWGQEDEFIKQMPSVEKGQLKVKRVL